MNIYQERLKWMIGNEREAHTYSNPWLLYIGSFIVISPKALHENYLLTKLINETSTWKDYLIKTKLPSDVDVILRILLIGMQLEDRLF